MVIDKPITDGFLAVKIPSKISNYQRIWDLTDEYGCR